MMKKNIILFVASFFLFVMQAFAQGPGNGGPIGPGGPDDEEPPTGVPIDGGASLLLAAGAGYGLKKLRDKRNVRKKLDGI